MSKLISIRDDLYEKLKELKGNIKEIEPSFSDVINSLFITIELLKTEKEQLQETTVTQEGRISKTLAGKTILFKIKKE